MIKNNKTDKNLILILDCNPLLWSKNHDFASFLDQIHLYITSYVTLDVENAISILALTGPNQSKWLVQSVKSGNLPELEVQYKTFFNSLNAACLYESITHANDTESSLASDIARALGQSLCYINKKRCQNNLLLESKEKNSTTSNTYTDKILLVVPDMQFQIEQQYLNLINSAFCAKENLVSIDILITRKNIRLSKNTISQTQGLLNQVSDLTGGVLHICEDMSQLYHILSLCFMMDKFDKNDILNSSNQTKVDYRTATFDTKKLVSMGFVCSICLGVFEKFYSICPMCESIVKVNFEKLNES